MKNIILSLVALVALTMVACGPNKVAQANKALYTESMAAIDSLSTLTAFNLFQEDCMAKESAFISENAQAIEKFTEEEKKAIETAKSEWVVKLQQKANELVLTQTQNDSTSVETAVEEAI